MGRRAAKDRFSADKIAEIQRRLAAGETRRALAAAYGCSSTYIQQLGAKTGKTAVSVAAAGRTPLADPSYRPDPEADDELDAYDRRRWELVRRIDEELSAGPRPLEVAALVRAQNNLLVQLQSAAQIRRHTGDSTDGLSDIAAGVRARLQRLAAAQTVAVPVPEPEPTADEPTGTDGR